MLYMYLPLYKNLDIIWSMYVYVNVTIYGMVDNKISGHVSSTVHGS